MSGPDPADVAGRPGGVAADPARAAEEFAELFRSVYLTFHRRDGRRGGLTAASSAVLHHLAGTGPLTVGGAARHLDRAQSVVTEIVAGLAGKGLLERERDPADRRRTLVWLSPAGFAALRARASSGAEVRRRASAGRSGRTCARSPQSPRVPTRPPIRRTCVRSWSRSPVRRARRAVRVVRRRAPGGRESVGPRA